MNGIDHQARRAMIVMYVRYYDGIVGGINSQMAKQLAIEDRPSCRGKGGSRGSEISLKVASKICKMALASNREARVVAGPK